MLIVTVLFFSCRSLSPVDGKAERSARLPLVSAPSPELLQPQWQPVPIAADGLTYCAGKVSRPHIKFYALRVDLSSPYLRMQAAGGGGKIADNTFLSIKVSTFVRENGLLAGINALPFDPVSGKEGEPRTNVGIVIADGVMVSPPHSGFDALVL